MFRFTIRELVLMTLVAAMGVAWWLDRTSLAEALQNMCAVDAIAKMPMRMD
jgi:hypothetical protein